MAPCSRGSKKSCPCRTFVKAEPLLHGRPRVQDGAKSRGRFTRGRSVLRTL
jgi:hypothetical protein